MFFRTMSRATSSRSRWQPAGRYGNPCWISDSSSRRVRPSIAAVAEVEAELFALVADEVEHGQDVFAFRAAEASAELLEEDRGALGWSEHE